MAHIWQNIVRIKGNHVNYESAIVEAILAVVNDKVPNDQLQ